MSHRQTHEEIMAHPKVVRCLGKLDGYAIYVAKTGYMTPLNGVTLRLRELDQEMWQRVLKEMDAPDRNGHNSIFLEEYQVEDLLKWADLTSISSPENAAQETYCTECKDGWYVGLVEKRICPTCNGTRKVTL